MRCHCCWTMLQIPRVVHHLKKKKRAKKSQACFWRCRVQWSIACDCVGDDDGKRSHRQDRHPRSRPRPWRPERRGHRWWAPNHCQRPLQALVRGVADPLVVLVLLVPWQQQRQQSEQHRLVWQCSWWWWQCWQCDLEQDRETCPLACHCWCDREDDRQAQQSHPATPSTSSFFVLAPRQELWHELSVHFCLSPNALQARELKRRAVERLEMSCRHCDGTAGMVIARQHVLSMLSWWWHDSGKKAGKRKRELALRKKRLFLFLLFLASQGRRSDLSSTFPRPFLDLSSTFLAPLLCLPSLAWQGFPRPHEEALR